MIAFAHTYSHCSSTDWSGHIILGICDLFCLIGTNFSRNWEFIVQVNNKLLTK